MSRYIDFHLIGELVDSHGNVHYEDLKNLPIADVVEVVRCKDCKHAEIQDYAPPSCRYCCKYSALFHAKNFYCSMGERREGDKE